MQLLKAVEDKGPASARHDHIMTLHRREWPTLWDAIDRVLAEYRIELVNRLGHYHE